MPIHTREGQLPFKMSLPEYYVSSKYKYNSQAICLLAKFQDLPILKLAYNRLIQPSKITVGSSARNCPSAGHPGHSNRCPESVQSVF